MKEPEYWRINLAVEKVIARHEHEILMEKAVRCAPDYPLNVVLYAGLTASLSAEFAGRVRDIVMQAKLNNNCIKAVKRIIEIRGMGANDAITGAQIAELMRD